MNQLDAKLSGISLHTLLQELDTRRLKIESNGCKGGPGRQLLVNDAAGNVLIVPALHEDQCMISQLCLQV